MLEREFLLAWEREAVELDEKGESEAYFPTWGYMDTDAYLAESNRYREEHATVLPDAEAEPNEAACEAPPIEQPSAVALVEEPAQSAVTPVATRVAWGAFYWIKRVVVLVALCLVGSIVATMVMNPGLTFEGVVSLFGQNVSAIFSSFFGS